MSKGKSFALKIYNSKSKRLIVFLLEKINISDRIV